MSGVGEAAVAATKKVPHVFVSYSHKDKAGLEALREQLKGLKNADVLTFWDDRALLVGEAFDDEIRDQLEKADIVVALVSTPWLGSSYVHGVEMARFRDGNASARLFPVLLETCLWKAHKWLKPKTLALADSGRGERPIRGLNVDEQHEAWVSVGEELLRLVERVSQELLPAPAPSPPPPPADQSTLAALLRYWRVQVALSLFADRKAFKELANRADRRACESKLGFEPSTVAEVDFAHFFALADLDRPSFDRIAAALWSENAATISDIERATAVIASDLGRKVAASQLASWHADLDREAPRAEAAKQIVELGTAALDRALIVVAFPEGGCPELFLPQLQTSVVEARSSDRISAVYFSAESPSSRRALDWDRSVRNVTQSDSVAELAETHFVDGGVGVSRVAVFKWCVPEAASVSLIEGIAQWLAKARVGAVKLACVLCVARPTGAERDWKPALEHRLNALTFGRMAAVFVDVPSVQLGHVRRFLAGSHMGLGGVRGDWFWPEDVKVSDRVLQALMWLSNARYESLRDLLDMAYLLHSTPSSPKVDWASVLPIWDNFTSAP